MTTKTTEEAMEVLNETRSSLIELGRQVADELIREHGKTNSTDVYNAMRERGLINEQVRNHWLGALFRDRKRYRWIGEWATGLAKGPHQHSPNPVRVWAHA